MGINIEDTTLLGDERTVSTRGYERTGHHRQDHRILNARIADFSIVPAGGALARDNVVFGSVNSVAADISASVVLGGGSTNYENIVGGDGSATVNTSTPNATSTGSGADLSTIVGGYDNVAGGLSSAILGADHCYTGLETTHGTLLGTINKIDHGNYGVISGGRENSLTAIDPEVTIPNDSVISGGYGNAIADVGGAIAGGVDNTVTFGAYSAILGGYQNTVSNTLGVAMGYKNLVTGTFATVLGVEGHASVSGALTMGGGKFAIVGDAQTTTLILKVQSTDGTGNNLLDGSGSFGNLVVPTDTTWMFMARVVARRTDADGESAAYTLVGCIDNNAGTTALVGTVDKTVHAEDSAGWDITANAYDPDNLLYFTAVGEADKTINWVLRLDLVEVTG